MEGEGIDNCHSLVEEVGIGALVGKLAIAEAVVVEQQSKQSIQIL